ncbi:hypothetical protein [Komagataeibacter kakiaceti]|uniref:hypothetical protein n=1 Tax=Komagataeibacter kakiaceti TaxID=943261 RepID=UPI001F57E23E|nr:hypothetical protein [Komagataeibacter kakiaceti]
MQLKQIGRLSAILPEILAWIEAGKGPGNRELASIALASTALQEQVWGHFGFPVGSSPPEDVEACEDEASNSPTEIGNPVLPSPIGTGLRQPCGRTVFMQSRPRLMTPLQKAAGSPGRKICSVKPGRTAVIPMTLRL